MSASRRAVLMLMTGSSLVQSTSNALAAVLATYLLGADQRGVMVVGLTVSSLVVLGAGLGTGAAFRARLPAVEASPARLGVVSAYTWWSVAGIGVGAAASVIACRGVAAVINPALARPEYLAAIAVVTAGQVGLAQLTDAWYAAGRFRAGGIWAAAAATAGLVGMLVGATVGRSAWVLLLAQASGSVAVAAAEVWRLRSARLLWLGRPDRVELSGLLRKGPPVLGLTIGLFVATRADRVILGAVAGTAAVGVYALAATLSEVPRMLSAAVGQVAMREVAAGGGLAEMRRARNSAVTLTAVGGVAVAAGGWLLIVPVFGSAFASARPALLVLLVAETCLAVHTVASRCLLGAGRSGLVGMIGVVGAVAGVALFCLTIPLWTILGAAVASAVLYQGLSVASWSALRRAMAPAPVSSGANRGVPVSARSERQRAPQSRTEVAQ